MNRRNILTIRRLRRSAAHVKVEIEGYDHFIQPSDLSVYRIPFDRASEEAFRCHQVARSDTAILRKVIRHLARRSRGEIRDADDRPTLGKVISEI